MVERGYGNMFVDACLGYWSQFDFDLTPSESRRENGYAVTKYIAEFWCFMSSLVIVMIGLWFGSISLTLAGSISCLSHAIPFLYLLILDKLAMLGVFFEFLGYHYHVIWSHPWLLGLVPILGLLNITDVYLARNYGWTISHVIWHLSASLITYIFLSYTV